MTTPKEIKKQIRELKGEMKRYGIRVGSCFNGGHSPESMRYNQTLFALKVQLERAQAAQ